MVSYGIHDIKFSGRFFTWTNKQAGTNRVLSKIDRVLGNNLWDDTYPMAEVLFLPEGLFYHSAMLVQFFNNPKGKRPFRFYNHWATQDTFLEIVKAGWETSITDFTSFQITEKLKLLKKKLKTTFHCDLLLKVQEVEATLLSVQGHINTPWILFWLSMNVMLRQGIGK